VDWDSATGKWQNAFRGEDLENLELDGFKGEPFKAGSGVPGVYLDRIRGFSQQK
jgi:hypothetical protein